MKTPVINNVQVYGLEDSIKAAKYPMATDIAGLSPVLTDGIKSLAMSEKGAGHDNWLQGVVVQFDLTLSLKAWVEAQRYHFLDFVSSQSTMHRITRFDIAEQCNKYVDPETISRLKAMVTTYNQLADDDPAKKEAYLTILYNIPSGFRYTARMTTNYRQLKTIYAQRKSHRLPEWREFCAWIRTLPYAYLITGCEVTLDEAEEKIIRVKEETNE